MGRGSSAGPWPGPVLMTLRGSFEQRFSLAIEHLDDNPHLFLRSYTGQLSQ